MPFNNNMTDLAREHWARRRIRLVGYDRLIDTWQNCPPCIQVTALSPMKGLGVDYPGTWNPERSWAWSLFEQAVHRMFRADIRFQPQGVTANAPQLDINILKMDKEADDYFYDLSVRAANGASKVKTKYLDRYMVPTSETKESVHSVWNSSPSFLPNPETMSALFSYCRWRAYQKYQMSEDRTSSWGIIEIKRDHRRGSR